jgi:lactoylglutathione lyase
MPRRLRIEEVFMKVRRIVANIETADPAAVARFYKDVLGLDLLMDHGWIATYGSDGSTMPLQVSFASEGGSGAPVPGLSVEVDDVEAVYAAAVKGGYPVEYGPADEPWGVRRLFVRDPAGTLVNILMHMR